MVSIQRALAYVFIYISCQLSTTCKYKNNCTQQKIKSIKWRVFLCVIIYKCSLCRKMNKERLKADIARRKREGRKLSEEERLRRLKEDIRRRRREIQRREKRKRKEEEKKRKEEDFKRDEKARRARAERRRREEDMMREKEERDRRRERERRIKETKKYEEMKERRGETGGRGRRKRRSSSLLTEKERRQRDEEETHKYKNDSPPCHSKVYLLFGRGSASEGLVRWKVKKDSKVVQLHHQTNLPVGRSFRFDRVFLKSGNRVIYQLGLREVVHYFCSSHKSVAVILYGPSHTGKSRYVRGPAGQPRGLLQRAFSDIFTYLKTVKASFCMLRVSYVEIYKERVEDLLVDDSYKDTSAPTPGLRLASDSNGCVVWCGAKEFTVTKMEQVEELFTLGHSEHVKRGRRTEGRLEASHTIFRIILESLPRFDDYCGWEDVAVSISFLDFVQVAGSELLPTLSSVTDELRGGPPLTRSLYALHHFVSNYDGNNSELFDDRQTTLTRILRDSLVGGGHSVFLCSCSHTNIQHTLPALRFGEAAAWLVQHPCKKLYTSSHLHLTISQLLRRYQVLNQEFHRKDRGGHWSVLQGSRKRAIKREVCNMLSLGRLIFPLNVTIALKTPQPDPDRQLAAPKKRGRPRKHPIKPKPFGPEQPAKIDYISLWKSRFLSFLRTDEEKLRKKKEEKFYMAGKFDLTTTSKRHSLKRLYHTGSLTASDKNTYHGCYWKKEGIPQDRFAKEGDSGVFCFVKGCITITRRWDMCVEDVMAQYLDKMFKFNDYKPKKVCFPLRNMTYKSLKWKLDDGYVHFLRLALWIRYFQNKFARKIHPKKQAYSMPDFIAPKEVFLDLFLTPYRKDSRLWRMKAVSFEDGRVYIQSDRTIARTPEKLSPEAAFNSHLLGHCFPDADDESGRTKSVVPFPGQYWLVYWGEVDGLGLFYSSHVDLIDPSYKAYTQWFPSKSTAGQMLRKIISKRHFMYRTHLYQAPEDTGAWREKMWFTFLEWWAEYQFGKIPNIIGGEVSGQVVRALRLYCPQTLPQLAEAWCGKPAWDPALCKQYLSSVLRFIKHWCSRWPRETLSFELQENGDLLCCKRKFKIASSHFLVSSILPDQFIKDVYPAPPPKPKPSWPGKRGRKCKSKPAPCLTKTRDVPCYWDLPRYRDLERKLRTSPPCFVQRGHLPKKRRARRAKRRVFRQAGVGQGVKGAQTKEEPQKTKKCRPRKPKPGAPSKLVDPKSVLAGLTKVQLSRAVDKRARDWYKSTLPQNVIMDLPKSYIYEERGKYSDESLSFSDCEEEAGKWRPARKQRSWVQEEHGTALPDTGQEKPTISEDAEVEQSPVKYTHPVIGPIQRRVPRMKGMQRIKKVCPVPPVPEDDEAYFKHGQEVKEVMYQGNLDMTRLNKRTFSDEDEFTDMIGVM